MRRALLCEFRLQLHIALGHTVRKSFLITSVDLKHETCIMQKYFVCSCGKEWTK